jgi:hypothetical protein
MERLKTMISGLASSITILGIIIILAINSHTTRPAFQAAPCNDLVRCERIQKPIDHPDMDKIPTLAPPRKNSQSKPDNALHSPLPEQTVYVKVTIDHADIEVGWAPGEIRDR